MSRGARLLRSVPITNVPAWEKKGEQLGVKSTDDASADPEQVRRYRVSKYRVALVREGTLPVAEKIVREPADVARLMTPLDQSGRARKFDGVPRPQPRGLQAGHRGVGRSGRVGPQPPESAARAVG